MRGRVGPQTERFVKGYRSKWSIFQLCPDKQGGTRQISAASVVLMSLLLAVKSALRQARVDLGS